MAEKKKPGPPKKVKTREELAIDAEQHRINVRDSSRKAFDAAADIGEIPKPKDPGRRAACGQSLHEFLKVYYPNSTGLSPLGPDQIAAVERVEVALREEGWVANIMPRGFIKSTLSENSLTWALLYGLRKYGLFFAGTASLAETGILSIKRELVTNELLLEDFPEACIPFIKLEGKAQRTQSQTYRGALTNLIAKGDTIRLAMIPGYPCAGAIIEGYGLLAPPRGARFKNELGENVRPSVAVLDDPQTDDSSRSITQTESRMRYMTNSISMMGGHGKEMSLIVNATIINDGDLADQISDPDKSPEWQSVRTQMIKKMPAALETHWMGQYATLRRSYDRDDPRGRIKARMASTEYLKAHYEEMHRGAAVAWENIGLEKTEISALQHGMNILIDKGPDTFWAECQNKPIRLSSVSALEMNKDELITRISGYGRGVVPSNTGSLVFGIDVHDALLFYSVAAVESNFTGTIIDYGVWPEQPNTHFSLRSAKNTLQNHYKQSSVESAIELGVEDLIDKILSAGWQTTNGDFMPVTAGLVDQGYKPTEVRNAIRRLMPRSNIVLSSRGIGKKQRLFEEGDFSPKKVVRCGPDQSRPKWSLPHSERDGDLFGIHFDANYWKSILAARFMQQNTVARWQLFGDRNVDHSHYIDHLTSEAITQKTGDGLTQNVWEVIAARPNHWWDTAVLCAVAASLSGATLPVQELTQVRQLDIIPTVTEEEKLELFKRDDGRGFFITSRD